MIELSTQQEELFFKLASYMDAHKQEGFRTMNVTSGIPFIRVHFLPSQSEAQAYPNQLRFERDKYDATFSSLQDYFDNMHRDHPGVYRASYLAHKGWVTYRELVNAKILKRLSKEEAKALNHEDIGVSEETFAKQMNLLIKDKSVAKKEEMLAKTNVAHYQLSSRGVDRTDEEMYDLTIPFHPIGENNQSINISPSPFKITDERVPESVRVNVDEANHCLSFGAVLACAVMARRAVQAICIDKGANPKKKLENQIDELGIISQVLKDQAHAVRWVGNDAAHLTAYTVTNKDAEDALRLVDILTNYLYIGPAIAQEQKTKRGK